MTKISSAAILKAINCKYLELVRVPGKDAGYWYFVYDDEKNNIYETVSVYRMFLSHMDITRWIEIGSDFVKLAEAKTAEKLERES